ncbi:hypothetical protein [Vibrio crassostreae]|uniref:hypothetical protein n=1 Tax=Vibrio crassostreae TaxID=246167 RepID=UPI00104FF664|nr:hypothetical protein [Vibrio crassostreae]TCO01442.1 hypothetical protein EDB51_107191 [Vibrio crassostreae]CAK2086480.1 Oxidoreductase-like domain-containing protein [Vibrio crassostreae]CAK2095111.1 Oxidoreductase-like domain-containing protein [Vibrio crassostreae]CAK2117152.1 Oxidoreductase-like domain-containing protein [Vibrio crassostreae]CAK2878306.1 Oxidoreductase-like domain-containing protein [Vibrio crassostreae]
MSSAALNLQPNKLTSPLIATQAPSLKPLTPKKPDLNSAMLNLIEEVKNELPLYESETFICGPKGNCSGCSKKLLDMVESELMYWEHSISIGQGPNFEELRRFGKLCSSVRRGLERNGLVEKRLRGR